MKNRKKVSEMLLFEAFRFFRGCKVRHINCCLSWNTFEGRETISLCADVPQDFHGERVPAGTMTGGKNTYKSPATNKKSLERLRAYKAKNAAAAADADTTTTVPTDAPAGPSKAAPVQNKVPSNEVETGPHAKQNSAPLHNKRASSINPNSDEQQSGHNSPNFRQTTPILTEIEQYVNHMMDMARSNESGRQTAENSKLSAPTSNEGTKIATNTDYTPTRRVLRKTKASNEDRDVDYPDYDEYEGKCAAQYIFPTHDRYRELSSTDKYDIDEYTQHYEDLMDGYQYLFNLSPEKESTQHQEVFEEQQIRNKQEFKEKIKKLKKHNRKLEKESNSRQ